MVSAQHKEHHKKLAQAHKQATRKIFAVAVISILLVFTLVMALFVVQDYAGSEEALAGQAITVRGATIAQKEIPTTLERGSTDPLRTIIGNEDCDNGVDDDADGDTDCDDSDCNDAKICVPDTVVVPPEVSSSEDCSNNIDDDSDGDTDCDDSDCVTSRACLIKSSVPDTESDCNNDIDDDGDGLEDCDDVDDCGGSIHCAPPLTEDDCDNSFDDDVDGWEDCADLDCASSDACVQYFCYQDLDGDGWGNEEVNAFYDVVCDSGTTHNIPDCNDLDNIINPDATEVCGDGVDNNCDGMIDCDDISCAEDVSCVNTIDFDGNEIISILDANELMQACDDYYNQPLPVNYAMFDLVGEDNMITYDDLKEFIVLYNEG
jgi:hypothetical protein